MDFEGAIKAHSTWMLRLYSYAEGTSREKLDAQMIAKDNLCELGKWIQGEGLRYGREPEFQELVKAHAAFHKSAAAIVDLVDQGRRASAEKVLKSADSDYRQRSFQVTGLLRKLQNKHVPAK